MAAVTGVAASALAWNSEGIIDLTKTVKKAAATPSIGFAAVAALCSTLLVTPVFAASPAQAQPTPPRPAPAAVAPPAAAPIPQQPLSEWETFPTMLLEKIFRGPLRDTIIQRWRDPVDGTVCFLYLPISSPLTSPPSGQAYAQYGPNQIGSISCVHPTQVLQLWQGAAPPPVPAPVSPTKPR